MFIRRTFGTHKENPGRPAWSADVEVQHRQQQGHPPGHQGQPSNKLSQTLFDKPRKVRREKGNSLGAVDRDNARGTEALVQEQQGVLLGTRDAGVLGSLVGSRQDQGGVLPSCVVL